MTINEIKNILRSVKVESNSGYSEGELNAGMVLYKYDAEACHHGDFSFLNDADLEVLAGSCYMAFQDAR